MREYMRCLKSLILLKHNRKITKTSFQDNAIWLGRAPISVMDLKEIKVRTLRLMKSFMEKNKIIEI